MDRPRDNRDRRSETVPSWDDARCVYSHRDGNEAGETREEATVAMTPEQMEREARELMLGGYH